MLVNEQKVHAAMIRIAVQLTKDQCLQQDLFQEALLHLWKIEREEPGHTTSWYLQSCRFRMLHYLNKGRSIDSQRRRSRGAVDDEEWEELHERLSSTEEVWADISARDFLIVLRSQLSDSDWTILRLLMQGFSAREIATKVKLSHQAICKRRRSIAMAAAKLGFTRVWRETQSRSGNGGHEATYSSSPRPSPPPLELRRE